MNFQIPKNAQLKSKDSRSYTAPKSNVTIVRMETGIAASSTTVTPTNSSSRVQEEFDMQEQERGIDW